MKRKYNISKTPYQRLMQSKQIFEEANRQTYGFCQGFNLTELKRRIEGKHMNSASVMRTKGERKKLFSLEDTPLVSLQIV